MLIRQPQILGTHRPVVRRTRSIVSVHCLGCWTCCVDGLHGVHGAACCWLQPVMGHALLTAAVLLCALLQVRRQVAVTAAKKGFGAAEKQVCRWYFCNSCTLLQNGQAALLLLPTHQRCCMLLDRDVLLALAGFALSDTECSFLCRSQSQLQQQHQQQMQ
jgi:hypothetical protein